MQNFNRQDLSSKFRQWMKDNDILSQVTAREDGDTTISEWQKDKAGNDDEPGRNLDTNTLMTSNEMLWASPSRIVDALQRLGTNNEDISFPDSINRIKELQTDLFEPILADTIAVFKQTLSEPIFFKTKSALSRSMAGTNQKGGLITLLRNGDEDILKLDYENNLQKSTPWIRTHNLLAPLANDTQVVRSRADEADLTREGAVVDQIRMIDCRTIEIGKRYYEVHFLFIRQFSAVQNISQMLSDKIFESVFLDQEKKKADSAYVNSVEALMTLSVLSGDLKILMTTMRALLLSRESDLVHDLSQWLRLVFESIDSSVGMDNQCSINDAKKAMRFVSQKGKDLVHRVIRKQDPRYHRPGNKTAMVEAMAAMEAGSMSSAAQKEQEFCKKDGVTTLEWVYIIANLVAYSSRIFQMFKDLSGSQQF